VRESERRRHDAERRTYRSGEGARSHSGFRPDSTARWRVRLFGREYPYRGRTLKAYYAVGNGSQFAMFIPDLDVVIGHYAGNYNDRANTMLDQLIPRVILPAIQPGKQP